MHHIVSLSGGSASAVAADRVINRYGLENTILWFADTLWEDEDLYRFLEDLEMRWEKKIIRNTDGRNPLQVAEDRKLIPSSYAAPCSYYLKQLPFRKFLQKHAKPITVHLGLDFTEEHRHAKPKEIYEQMEGVSVDFPLMWEPLPYMGYTKTIEEWGIEIPRLYKMGFLTTTVVVDVLDREHLNGSGYPNIFQNDSTKLETGSKPIKSQTAQEKTGQ